MTNYEKAEKYINILEQEGKFPIKDWAKEFLGNFARYLDQEAAKGHDKNCLITKGQGLCDCKANALESTVKDDCGECTFRRATGYCSMNQPKTPKSEDKEVSDVGRSSTPILPQKPKKKIEPIEQLYYNDPNDKDLKDKINELINAYNND